MFRFLFPAFALTAVILVAGCGGGGGTTPSVPTPGPSATINPGPSPQNVTLTGGGYALSFTLPAVTVGSTATVTATLSTSAPTGVPVPQSRRAKVTKEKTTPSDLGTAVNPLVYLTISSTAQISFANAPSFVFALPSNVSVPAGSSAYVIYYDPNGSIGWINLLGPGAVSGHDITFNGVPTGFTFKANTPYVFALALTIAPLPTVAPSPTVAPTTIPNSCPAGPAITPAAGSFPLTVVNSNTSVMASCNITLYVYGQNSSSTWESGNVDGSVNSLATAGSMVAGIPWQGGSTNSETVYLPPFAAGARVYIVGGNSLASIFKVVTAGGGPTAPAPWSNDGSQSVYFDDIEYADTSGNLNFDVSQTDAIGLDLQVSATNAGGTQTIGLKPGAMAAVQSGLRGLGSPWNTLQNEMPYHIINPQHGSPNFFPSSSFLDSALATAWSTYSSGNWMVISAASLSATTYPGNLYGTEDASGNMNFYATQSIAGTLIGTIENPATYAAVASNNTTFTQEVMAQNGAFGNFTTPNTTYPTLGAAIGNRVSGALNSGVFSISAQPACGAARFNSGGSAYQNQYANVLHSVANTYAYVAGAAYGYPYDDLCGTSTDTTSAAVQSMTITINP